jgi:acetyltransferase-like isoleucine patch superfamily enzyme
MGSSGQLGLASRGQRVAIDQGARILRPELIHIGNDVRIDAGVVLSASFPIRIGDHVHIAAGAKLFASGGYIELSDFANISADVKLYTSTDDYTGGSLTNPTVPNEFKDVIVGSVRLGKHVIVGAGSVVLPGVSLEFGAAVGALSLVKHDVPEGFVMAGVPARRISTRDVARLRLLESEFRSRGPA